MLEAIVFYTCQNWSSFRRWMLEAFLFYTCQNFYMHIWRLLAQRDDADRDWPLSGRARFHLVS